MTKKYVDGMAIMLSCNDSLFYDIFSAGEKFENDKRYNIADHIDLTGKAWEQLPDFMRNQLPTYCEIYGTSRRSGAYVKSLRVEC